MFDDQDSGNICFDLKDGQRRIFLKFAGAPTARGSERFMSPEEFTLGAVIDEVTNVYTVGAMAFAMFANYSREAEVWTLSEEKYLIAKKAVSDNREERWSSLSELLSAWTSAR